MEELVPIFAMTVGLIIAVTAMISKYKLKAEQIKADALVRAEEVRTRNQLELERLMRQDEMKVPGGSQSAGAETIQNGDYTERKARVRE
jgi:hypothetical protein